MRVTEFLNEDADKRKQNALWAQITAHEKAAKQTKDIKRDHHLKMANQLRSQLKTTDNVAEGEVVAFPKKHKGDLSDTHNCPKCGGDLQGGKYQGHEVKVCMPCKQVYLPPNSGIDQQGNPIKEAGVAEGEPRKTMGLDASLDQHFNDKKHLLNPGVAHRGQLVTIIKAPRMLDLLPGETFEVRSSDADGVTLKHGLGTKFDNVKFPHGTYKISKAQGVAEAEIDRPGMKDGRPYSDPYRRHTGNSSYMTPEYLIQKYKERLAQIAAGPYKRPKEVAQLQSRIAKLEKQGVAEETSNAPTKYRATVEYGPTAADAHFVTVTASSTEEAEAKVQKWCEKKGVRNPMITINGADRPVDEGATDTVYPGAEVIKSKNGKPVGEIYQDASGWGCLHYRADNGADSIESREEAIEWLKDLHDEYRQDRSLREQSVAEEKTRLDPKCWTGKKIGNPKTKIKGGVRVNNCVPAESVEEAYGPYGKRTPQDLERIKKHLEREKKNAVSGQLKKTENPTKKTQYDNDRKLSYFTKLEEYNAEYDDEAGMAQGSLHTLQNAVAGLQDVIDSGDNLPEWCQEKISLAEDYLVTVWDYIQSEKAQGIDPEISEEFDLVESIINRIAAQNGVDAEMVWEDLESLSNDELYAFAVTSQLNEDWSKVNKKDKTDGMSQKAVNAYRRENPGSKLKTAVTTKPSKLKKGSKASKRRKSYCSRSKGQMNMHNISCAKTPDKAICKARRRWNC